MKGSEHSSKPGGKTLGKLVKGAFFAIGLTGAGCETGLPKDKLTCKPLVCTDTLRKEYGQTACAILDGSKRHTLPFNIAKWQEQPDFFAIAGTHEEIGEKARFVLNNDNWFDPKNPSADYNTNLPRLAESYDVEIKPQEALLINPDGTTRKIPIGKIDTVKQANVDTSEIMSISTSLKGGHEWQKNGALGEIETESCGKTQVFVPASDVFLNLSSVARKIKVIIGNRPDSKDSDEKR